MPRSLDVIMTEAIASSYGGRFIAVDRVLAALAQAYVRHLADPSPVELDAQSFTSTIINEIAADFGVDFQKVWKKVSGEYFD